MHTVVEPDVHSSASLGLTDYCQAGVLGMRYRSVNFRAITSSDHATGRAGAHQMAKITKTEIELDIGGLPDDHDASVGGLVVSDSSNFIPQMC